MAGHELSTAVAGFGANERRRVLVPVHSVSSGQRLLDVVELVEPDPRIEIAFAKVPTTSANGIDGFLTGLGVPVLPWADAVTRTFDLAIVASCGGLHDVRAPLVVAPPACGRRRPMPATGPGAGTPTLLLVARVDDQTESTCVTGDPSFDRLTASMRSRDRYRQALGVDRHHQLVVVVSASGATSLICREPALLRRLVVELPEDHYRVAVLVHPAAWFSQDIQHIKAWMTTVRTAAVQIIDPFTEWRPVVAAADMVVGDSGSITLCGAGIGLPVLLADAASSVHGPLSLWADTPRLRRDVPLPVQLDAARAWRTPEFQRRVVEHITSAPGGSARLIRHRIYRMLCMPPPLDTPVITPIRGPRRMI